MESQISNFKPLIVNADDFGLSDGVNRGIVRAHEEGIVTSASLMVRQPGAADAASYARHRPRLSVGLHLDLGEWVYRDGAWVATYEVAPADDAEAMNAEVAWQVETFLRLVDRPPTHVDSHQHAHRSEPLLAAARAVAQRFGVPLRHFTPGVGYCGDFYGQTGKGETVPEAISVEALVKLIRSLPQGVTELACHPGADLALKSVYCRERLREVETLCDSAVRGAVDSSGVRLISFLDV
ncbi:MAG TPA: ChbG/HpnK family deacetylase [Tepidisphaeraceae bacterium]|nr:ChbG/HpnK family deacetylase [Tepidisphaeraceae bacterium]